MTLLLSRKEKEELVIKLAREGKTTREIAKIVHISLKDIGEIIKKFTGESNSESNEAEKEKERLSKLSIYAQAFQLFREKKSLTEVVITLDLEADTVLYYYKDYLRLNHVYKLVNLYHNLGKDLPLFLHLFNRIKEEGLSREEIAYMIEIQSNIADKQETVVWLNKHIAELGKEK
jgi:transposase